MLDLPVAPPRVRPVRRNRRARLAAVELRHLPHSQAFTSTRREPTNREVQILNQERAWEPTQTSHVRRVSLPPNPSQPVSENSSFMLTCGRLRTRFFTSSVYYREAYLKSNRKSRPHVSSRPHQLDCGVCGKPGEGVNDPRGPRNCIRPSKKFPYN